ncbi:MAG: VCBS repeat-containing protein [Candidatus Marinimicrobia bacterium]|nr:VCBS repeat-containing protein [Candidatus Neomarinimicrobiota bacterium]
MRVAIFLLALVQWSSAQTQDVVQLEYYFDSDPGFGNGIQVTITSDTLVELSFTADLSSLSGGVHNLFVRAKNDSGLWSLDYQRTFVMGVLASEPKPDITRIEYYFDTDPGYGLGTSLTLIADSLIDNTYAIDLTNVSGGFHVLYIRAMNEFGMWSLTNTVPFIAEATGLGLAATITSINYTFSQAGVTKATGSYTAFTADSLVDLAFDADLSALIIGEAYDYSISAIDEYGNRTLQETRTITVVERWPHSPSPGLNALAVDPATDITVVFTENISGSTLNDNTIKVVGSLSGLHLAGISYDGPSKTATIDPTVDFAIGEKVTVTLTNGVQSLLGDPLPEPYSWSFTTAVSSGSGVFGISNSPAAGSQPFGAIPGDFNGDGMLDIAVANNASDNVSIFLNDGSGQFILDTTIAVGDGPEGLAAGDWDGDGDIDLAVAIRNVDSIVLLMNDGGGGFTVGSPVNVGDRPRAIGVGDWDGDGDLDLATVNEISDNLTILLNDGSGLFTVGSSPAAGDFPNEIAVGDWDSDGDLDLATANFNSDNVSILSNDGSGSFALLGTVPAGNGTSAIIAGDWDGDGDVDLATGNQLEDTATPLFNDGNGVFTQGTALAAGDAPQGITAGDWDGDGDLDWAVAAETADIVSIFTNDGLGNLTLLRTQPVGDRPISVQAGDWDGDGDLDLVTANINSGNITILTNKARVDILATTDSLAFGILESLTETDLTLTIRNEGGLNPLVISGISASHPDFTISPSTASINALESLDFTVTFAPNAVRLYTESLTIFSNDPDEPTVTIQLSGTGAPAVVASSPSANSLSGSNTGNITATFNAGMTPATLNDSTFLVFGEVSGQHFGAITYDAGSKTATLDPARDFVFGERVSVVLTDSIQSLADGIDLVGGHSWQFSVAPLFGSGFFIADGSPLSTGSAPFATVAGDFNMDGFSDLAAANSSVGTVSIFLNDQVGGYGAPLNITVGANPQGLAVGDVNADGKPDLIVANNGSANVSVLMGQGDGTFAAAVNYTTGAGPRAISVGDLDHDGYPDIVTGNITDDDISILFNLGDGTFGEATSIAIGGDPSGVIIADLDNDGDMDLAVSDKNASEVTVLLNRTESSSIIISSDFNDGFPSFDFTLFGDATYNSGEGRVYLTTASGGTGGLFYNEIIQADFINIRFDFEIGGGSGADGMTLAIFDSPVISGGGSAKGFFSAPTSGWGVVFDTFGGNRISLANPDGTVYATNASVPTLHNGGIFSFEIIFNSGHTEIYLENTSQSYPKTKIIDYTFAGIFEVNSYVGFTAATGGITDNHIVDNLVISRGTTANVVEGFFLDSTYTTGSAPNALVAFDFDGDGDVDLATANGTDDNVSVLLNDGTGVFGAAASIGVGTQPIALAAGDFDADGDMDLAALNFDSNDLHLLTNDGSGGFAPADTVAVGNGPRNLTALDISGELGIMDLVVANLVDANIAVLRNQIPGNLVARVVLGSIGEQSGDVVFSYNLFEANGDSIGIFAEYSPAPDSAWQPATVTGDTSRLGRVDYRGSFTWLSDNDLPLVSLDSARFRINAYTDTVSLTDSTNTFALDNDHRQSVAVALLETLVEYTGSVAMEYVITDSSYDAISIAGFYQLADSAWLPATLSGATTGLDSSAYADTLVWLSATDLPGVDDSVRLKLVPSDGWAYGSADSTALFHLDNNAPPTVALAAVIGEQSGDVAAGYSLSDTETDTLSIALFYSIDSSVTWSGATVTGATTGITTYDSTVIWNSAIDLPDLDLAAVSLSITPADNDAGTPDTSLYFQLDNNAPPTVILDAIAGEQMGEILIRYTLSDTEIDSLSLVAELQVVGTATWQPATVTGILAGIVAYRDSLVWASDSDLVEFVGDVYLRITPADADIGQADSVTINIDQIGAPRMVTLTLPTGELSGQIELSFTIADDEQDSIDLQLEFSLDSGSNWTIGTLTGATGLDTSRYTGMAVWQSDDDLPGIDNEAMMLRVTPWDGHWGPPLVTGSFHLDNNLPPAVSTTLAYGEYADVLRVPYLIVDPESDVVNLQLQYSVDNRATWNRASLVSWDTTVAQVNYDGALNWATTADFPLTDRDSIWLLLAVSDLDPGTGDTILVHIDNETGPKVIAVYPLSQSLALWQDTMWVTLSSASRLEPSPAIALSGSRFIPSITPFMLNDSLLAIVSSAPLSSADTLTVSLSAGAITDLNGIPLDGNGNGDPDGSPADDYSWEFYTTILGDYNLDGTVGFADLVIFREAWLSSPRDLQFELAPVAETIPHLRIVPDQKLDIEDLAVLARMWDWSLNPSLMLLADGLQKQHTENSEVQLAPRYDDNHWAPVDLRQFSLEIALERGITPAGLELKLALDPEVFEYTGFSPLGELADHPSDWIILDRYDEETGLLLLNLVKLSGAEPEDHSEFLVGELQLKVLRETDVDVIFEYTISHVEAPLDLVASLIEARISTVPPVPAVYALHHNFPNPFNPRTTIRYEVPEITDTYLVIFNLLGQQVLSRKQIGIAPGYYDFIWAGRDEQGRSVASGVYFARFMTPNYSKTIKMVLLK